MAGLFGTGTVDGLKDEAMPSLRFKGKTFVENHVATTSWKWF